MRLCCAVLLCVSEAVLICKSNTDPADGPIKKNLTNEIVHLFLTEPMISADGKMIFTAHATSALLNQYLGLGLNGISEAIVMAYKSLNHKMTRPQSIQGDVTKLDNALWSAEKSFWLTHWYGPWVASHLMKDMNETSKAAKEVIFDFYGCAPRYQIQSVSHGITWHFMAEQPWERVDLPMAAGTYCSKSLFFYLDCLHGVGHGLIHSYMLTHYSLPFPGYSVNSQLYRISLSSGDYDSIVLRCGGSFDFEEASGCVEGVLHSYFNYLPMNLTGWPVNWTSWCARRPWPAYCFRNVMQYGPLSLFGHQKDGDMTQVEYLTSFVGVRPPSLVKTPKELAQMCKSFSSPHLRGSCVYGIMTSSWASYIGNKDLFCKENFAADVLTFNTCNEVWVPAHQKHIEPLHLHALRKEQQQSTISRCKNSGDCNMDNLRFGIKGLPLFLCPIHMCPFKPGAPTIKL